MMWQQYEDDCKQTRTTLRIIDILLSKPGTYGVYVRRSVNHHWASFVEIFYLAMIEMIRHVIETSFFEKLELDNLNPKSCWKKVLETSIAGLGLQ